METQVGQAPVRLKICYIDLRYVVATREKALDQNFSP